jgi:signal transduction histidine kinase
VSTGLAVAILCAGLATVYEIERRQVDQTLAADARTAAAALAQAGRHAPTPPPGSGTLPSPLSGSEADGDREEQAIRTYLGAREGTDQLLASMPARGISLTNSPLARRLTRIHGLTAGGIATVSIGGRRYVVAASRRGTAHAIAAVPVAEAEAGVQRLLDAMLIVSAAGLLPAAAAAWLMARRALSPLSRIAQRASRITAGDLSVRMGPVAGDDEIADVAVAIDAMLDRLESAFDAQRRFVHDASHELRTPLTIARGHLEVALPAGEAGTELGQAVRVAIDELDRMGRLVDGLLRMAHADEPRDPGGAPIDIAALATRVVERSRVLGDRVWEVRGPDGPVMVAGDEGALEQVLLNLIANAVRHTHPGDSVALTVESSGGRVVVSVVDSGDGIDPSVLPTLFDRFTRADAARSRDTGGAGLGLSICRAIVEAHRGAIAATATPGGGATFTIDLPAAGRAPVAGKMRPVSHPAHV